MESLYSIWTLSSLATSLVASVIFIVSFSTRAWLVYYSDLENVHQEWGLWTRCNDSRNMERVCETISSPAGNFRAAQTFMCLAFICYIAAWVLQVFSVMEGSRRRLFIKCTVMCHFIVAFLLMVAVACIADFVQTLLGYSFYTAVFSCLLAILAAILRLPDLLLEYSNETKDDGMASGFGTLKEQPSTGTVSEVHI